MHIQSAGVVSLASTCSSPAVLAWCIVCFPGRRFFNQRNRDGFYNFLTVFKSFLPLSSEQAVLVTAGDASEQSQRGLKQVLSLLTLLVSLTHPSLQVSR